ncbi:MAG: hypothetical protein ACI362_06795 [Coriobacteriales bacterium]
MAEESASKYKRGQLPMREPKGRKWTVMAGQPAPEPPQDVPGFEGTTDISDVGDYFINSDY